MDKLITNYFSLLCLLCVIFSDITGIYPIMKVSPIILSFVNFGKFCPREVVKQSKWKKMDFSIRRQIPPPPIELLDIIYRHFLRLFFLLQLNPIYMKRILHLVSVKNVTFKSFYNWFKIDILWRLRPLTANHLAMFIVTSTTIYT